MQTPGAATACRSSSASREKLENEARLSSASAGRQLGAPPVPPGCPSLSAVAVTVRTSGNQAGTSGGGAPQSQPLFPAAAVYTTPASVELQIARCSGSPAQAL